MPAVLRTGAAQREPPAQLDAIPGLSHRLEHHTSTGTELILTGAVVMLCHRCRYMDDSC